MGAQIRTTTFCSPLAGLRSRAVVLVLVTSLLLLAGCPLSMLGQSAVATTPQASVPVLRYSPQSNLERSEMEALGRARVSIDVAMSSFTDRELAEELCRLARSGVRVRVYRDGEQYQQESERGQSTTEMLLAAGVQVKVKASRDLMHLKNYVIDGSLLRTGSSNWSPTGLKRQDNDLRYDTDVALVTLFETRFTEMWDPPRNLVPIASR